jgi:hypothetical protein
MVTKLHYNLPICYLIGILYSRVKYHKFQSYQNSLWLRTINFLLIKMFQCPTRSIQIETINHRREDLIFLVCFCFAFLLLFYLFVQTNGLSLLCFPIRLVYAFKEIENTKAEIRKDFISYFMLVRKILGLRFWDSYYCERIW